MASSQAPPQTPPSISAITGAGNASTARTSTRSGSSQPSGSRPARDSSDRSCPADHTLHPAGARTISARALSASNASSPARMSPISARLSAFRFSG